MIGQEFTGCLDTRSRGGRVGVYPRAPPETPVNAGSEHRWLRRGRDITPHMSSVAWRNGPGTVKAGRSDDKPAPGAPSPRSDPHRPEVPNSAPPRPLDRPGFPGPTFSLKRSHTSAVTCPPKTGQLQPSEGGWICGERRKMGFKFKVGVSLSLVESPDKDERLQALVESSMDYVEVRYAPHCEDAIWADLVRSKLDASSVKVNSIHAPFSSQVDISRLDDGGQEYAIEQIGKAIELAERLGADIVVVHGSAEPIGEDERSKRMVQSKSSLCMLTEQVQSAGARLAVELLPRTCLGNTADELEELLDGISPEYAGICLDANHPADPDALPSIVKQLAQRIITLHISDYDGIDEKHWMPFDGVINWRAFAKALGDIQYSGAFIYETLPAADTTAEKLEIIQSNFEMVISNQ